MTTRTRNANKIMPNNDIIDPFYWFEAQHNPGRRPLAFGQCSLGDKAPYRVIIMVLSIMTTLSDLEVCPFRFFS